MNFKRHIFFTAATIGLGCTFFCNARANSFLSGDLVGIFRSNSGANIDITNSAGGNASFRTGIATGNSFKSGVTFTGESFAGIGEGDTVSLGSLTYYNGVTRAGTSSHSAVLDLYLRLSDPFASWIHLSALNFAIDATLNATGREVPDNFLVQYSRPESALIGGEWLEFGINGLPAMTSVAENSQIDISDLTLTVRSGVPVPDAGASLLFVALGIALIMARGNLSRAESFWKFC